MRERHCVRDSVPNMYHVMPVGFEPTPFRTGALSQRLRPLGQSVLRFATGAPCAQPSAISARLARQFKASLQQSYPEGLGVGEDAGRACVAAARDPATLQAAQSAQDPQQAWQVRDSIVVSISACHAEDPGSIPGRGILVCFRVSDALERLRLVKQCV